MLQIENSVKYCIMWMNCKYIYLIFLSYVPKIIITSKISLIKGLKSMEIVSYNICSSKELIQTATIGKRRNEIILSLYIFI
jgi:hypothetical protein